MLQRDVILGLISLFATPLFAQEQPAAPTTEAPATPAPSPEPAAAPAVEAPTVAPEPAPASVDLARLIGNIKAGFAAPIEKKAVTVLFRGMNTVTPGGARLLIYLPPAHDPALMATLDMLGWTESTFGRMQLQVGSAIGRPLYKQLDSSAAVVAAVGSDPGGVGIINGSAIIDERVAVLWRSGGAP